MLLRKLWCLLWGHGDIVWEPRLRPGPVTPPFDTYRFREGLLTGDKHLRPDERTLALAMELRGREWGRYPPQLWEHVIRPWGSLFCLLSRWEVLLCVRCKGELDAVGEGSMWHVDGVRRPYSATAGWVTVGPLRRVWEYLQCQLIGHRTEWQRDVHYRAWRQHCETCGQEFGKPITDRGLRTVLSELCQWFRAPAKWWLEPQMIEETVLIIEPFPGGLNLKVPIIRHGDIRVRALPKVTLIHRQHGRIVNTWETVL